MSSEHSLASKLCKTEEQLTKKLRSPYVVFVQGTASWLVTADLTGHDKMSVLRGMTGPRYACWWC